jgi:hypothetical protein
MVLARLKQLRDRESARLKAWYTRYERLLMSASLLGGFLLDFFTFRTLDIQITLIGLSIHLSLVAATMLYVFRFDDPASGWRHPLWSRARTVAPLLTQLSFGSLLSMSFLFYWFSGVWSVSWPILAILVGLIVFNESFRHAYLRPTVQVSLFAFVLFSFFSLAFPHLFNSLETWVVLLGGVLGLGLSLLFVRLLLRLAPGLQTAKLRMIAAVSLVFVAMGALYSLDVLPPIPLSLQEAGMYYNIQRSGNEYAFTGESETYFQNLWPGQTLYQEKSGRIYAYSAIYSPANLNTTIYHGWEQYDPTQKKWIQKDHLSFPLTGGRQGGYRGYTFKTNLAPGKWRVTVETGRGQVLGRIPFSYRVKE